ncbi:MAG TPA: hypothetical protein VKA34_02660, partial [Balneolales bacterium]|nr:hypothetical protein [Balneolales bacterium]
MFQLKKIDLGSVAIYSFILYLILSLLFMIPTWMFYTMVNRLMPGMMGSQGQPSIFPFLSGFFFIILPIIYAFFGTIMNLIIAIAYNLISLKLGGLRFTVAKIDEFRETKTPPQPNDDE